jgi:lysozyme
MKPSVEARTEIRGYESLELRYYNDAVNNCTYGIGTLAHRGPCTKEELKRPVTAPQAEAKFDERIESAARAVRHVVRTAALTQRQFDGLVSYTYNRGAGNALKVLKLADRGDHRAVAREMAAAVWAHPIDAKGHKKPSVLLKGLIHRRRWEAAGFSDAKK